MADYKIDLDKLAEDWGTLLAELKRIKKVDAQLFDSAFSQTYFLLREKASDTSLERKLIKVVALAYLFANTELRELDCRVRATLALTERMIHCCGLGANPAPVEGTMIYIFEAHKDVYLDFTDVDATIEKLERLFRTEDWEVI